MEALKVNVGHPKTRKTQTAAYRLQKLEASQKLKEHLQHERKRRREQKARQWYQIQNQQKLEISKKEGQLSGLSEVKRWLARLLLGDAVQ